MNLRYVLTATLLGISACATSGPESTENVAMADDPASIDAAAATTSDDDTAVVADGGEESTDGADLPVVSGGQAEDGIVCRMERRAGSHLARRVCRNRTSMEMETLKAKETFENLRRSQDGNN